MTNQDRERYLQDHRTMADSITDDVLTKPVRDLTPMESIILEQVLRGPYGQEIIDRIDRINNG